MASVALIVLDTLRQDHFNEHFDWLPGTWYPNAYSTTNWTAPAHASLFTGLYPSETGVTAKSRKLGSDLPILPELASDQGYRTIGLSANHNASEENGFARGFDEFWGPTQLLNPDNKNIINLEKVISETDSSGVRLYLKILAECFSPKHDTIASLTRAASVKFDIQTLSKGVEDDGASTVLERSKIMNESEDTFLFVNLMEPHTPYNPPNSYNSLSKSITVNIIDTFSGVEHPSEVRQAYDDSVSYLSDIYKHIYSNLREKFEYIITVADHGEMLGEHNLWNHTYGLYPEVTKVPLVISHTSDESKTVSNRCVNLLDVNKTIESLLDIDSNSKGRDLLSDFEDRDLICEYQGLIPIAKKRLEEQGLLSEKVNSYDQNQYSLITSSGEYAILDSDENIIKSDIDDNDDKISSRIADIREEMECYNQEEIQEEISDDVMSRLEELGYA
ncbi:arylsulfatase [Haladaptatus litoreus]|uniref:Arylsulfatase n=1 Tax=Haladaptatus litoreus TaxID=553468 RepID=A0A1N7DKX0_9EURY|nr:sulfatase-like hydrolase/transferase [Haladaptatus litoreus]SIR76503.1 arylsulfatase [Haladaptatus litoreus]